MIFVSDGRFIQLSGLNILISELSNSSLLKFSDKLKQSLSLEANLSFDTRQISKYLAQYEFVEFELFKRNLLE